LTTWNLKDDWSWLFSMPISNKVAEDDYTLQIEEDSDGTKKLVIDIQSSNKIDILAMAPGEVTSNGDTTILTSDIFSVLDCVMESRIVEVSTNWFLNWGKAGRLPEKIHYENVIDCVSRTVKAGEVVGTAGNHPEESNKKQIKMKIEYADSTTNEPRFMHPREFFSLLFWKEECDPVLGQHPILTYGHPLLKKMMHTKEDGTSVTVSELYQNDDWLGLRPPLRTSQRVKWEASREHNIDNFFDYWGQSKNVTERIKNNLIENQNNLGYAGKSKCNIFAGEVLFRAGFMTTACLYRLPKRKLFSLDWTSELEESLNKGEIPEPLSEGINVADPYGELTVKKKNEPWEIEDKKKCKFKIMKETDSNETKLVVYLTLYYPCCNKCSRIQNKLRYMQPSGLMRNNYLVRAMDTKVRINVNNLEEDCRDFPSNESSHSIKLLYGEEVEKVDEINQNMRKKGYVYLAANSRHVVIVDKVLESTPPSTTYKVKAYDQRRIDEWDKAERFIRILPGDDPTEGWGIIRLNRLQEV